MFLTSFLSGSKIEWTDTTWNPTTGCNKVSAGCKFCYAERIALWKNSEGSYIYRNKFNLTLHPKKLNFISKLSGKHRIFVNSMSDLFHEGIPEYFLLAVFAIMNEYPQHTFQVLTKRPDHLLKMAPKLRWTPNIWMGVSVENQLVVDRISKLKQVPAAVKFISFEPLIGPITDLDLDGIQWVILGGESGYDWGKPKGYRECRLDWIRGVISQTTDQAVFVKQLGTTLGREFEMGGNKGEDFNKFPADLKRREYPIR